MHQDQLARLWVLPHVFGPLLAALTLTSAHVMLSACVWESFEMAVRHAVRARKPDAEYNERLCTALLYDGLAALAGVSCAKGIVLPALHHGVRFTGPSAYCALAASVYGALAFLWLAHAPWLGAGVCAAAAVASGVAGDDASGAVLAVVGAVHALVGAAEKYRPAGLLSGTRSLCTVALAGAAGAWVQQRGSGDVVVLYAAPVLSLLGLAAMRAPRATPWLDALEQSRGGAAPTLSLRMRLAMTERRAHVWLRDARALCATWTVAGRQGLGVLAAQAVHACGVPPSLPLHALLAYATSALAAGWSAWRVAGLSIVERDSAREVNALYWHVAVQTCSAWMASARAMPVHQPAGVVVSVAAIAAAALPRYPHVSFVLGLVWAWQETLDVVACAVLPRIVAWIWPALNASVHVRSPAWHSASVACACLLALGPRDSGQPLWYAAALLDMTVMCICHHTHRDAIERYEDEREDGGSAHIVRVHEPHVWASELSVGERVEGHTAVGSAVRARVVQQAPCLLQREDDGQHFTPLAFAEACPGGALTSARRVVFTVRHTSAPHSTSDEIDGLRTGDVLLLGGTGCFQLLFSRVLRSPYTHLGVVYVTPDGLPMLLHSITPYARHRSALAHGSTDGLMLSHLSETLAHYSHVATLRLRRQLTASESEHVIRHFAQRHHQPYVRDVLRILRAVCGGAEPHAWVPAPWRVPACASDHSCLRNKSQGGGSFCSEYAAALLLSLHRMPAEPVPLSDTLPAHFSITQPLGKHLFATEEVWSA